MTPMSKFRKVKASTRPTAYVIATLFAAGLATSVDPARVEAAPSKKAKDAKDAFQLERDLERYWSKRRAIKVVQRRLYPMRRKVELSLFGGVVPNDPFLVYVTGGLRLAYHIVENWALELSGAYTHGFDTPLRQDLQSRDALVQARLRDRVVSRFGLAALWSPIYGKFAVLNRKLAHFKMYFLLCGGAYYADEEKQLGLDGGVFPEWGVGLGMRFFFGDVMALRVELRQRMALRETAEGESGVQFAYPSEITVGLSFAFGGSKK